MTKAQDRILVQEHLAHESEPRALSGDERVHLEAQIKQELKARDAVLVAHYYTDPEIQAWLKKPAAAWLTRLKWPDSVISTRRLPW